MRALKRRVLVPLIVAASVLSAGGTAAGVAAAVVHPAGALADCPAGTNWDDITQTCQ